MRSGYDIGADEQPPAPVASFTHSAPDWEGQTVTFTNTTVVSGATSYLWAFGDGATTSAISPTHTYTSSGTYAVALTVTNYGGSSVATDTVTIYGAAFDSSTPDWLAETTTFTNTTLVTGTVTYQWAFGDGGISDLENPSYSYANPGLYTVILTATNDAATDVVTGTVTVFSAPVADFACNPTSGVCPLTVAFTDTTTTTPLGDPTVTHLWWFGDGTTSTLSNPTYTYTVPGAYTVALAAGNAAGSDILTHSHAITVYTPVQADFDASPTRGVAPLAVVFTNTSTGEYISSLWDFGDAITSTLSSPTHPYVEAGSYTVALTIDGPGGSDTETKPHYIRALQPTSTPVPAPTPTATPIGLYLPLILRHH